MGHNFLQFQKVYQDQPWWGHLHQTVSSHGDITGITAVEDDYLSLFKEIKKRKLDENTFIFFHSDHGSRYGPYRQRYAGRYEEHLPFMIIVPPKDFRQKFPSHFENMKSNFNKLTTFFDIHKTLNHILNLYNDKDFNIKFKHKRGVSLFSPITGTRTCESTPLKPEDCLCKIPKNVSANDPIVKTAALVALTYMNNLIKSHKKSDLCSKLTLGAITDASVLIEAIKSSTAEKPKDLNQRYLITFKVLPSNGTFEAMLDYSKSTKKYILSEGIERINKYGSQSDCVVERKLRGICFCKTSNKITSKANT
ncbi:unnamed protein product [Dimorphilus gyrociliatus]|uniref:Uncharacterized protein n=1 Tax=Dimorphilus gyrociliatus TaxID=2664684 RepID=A0A7I8VWV2_9ANNE|nr:unnamed protein product [Dimorphilus gyrociliatus]